jgi:hypothetical protein
MSAAPIDRNWVQSALDRCWPGDPVRAQRLAVVLALLKTADELRRKAEAMLARLEPESSAGSEGV